MANNYLQFSMSVPMKTQTEEEWCRASLTTLGDFLLGTEADVEQLDNELSSVVNEARHKDWTHQGFEWSISSAPDKAEQVAELWLYADESGEPEQVAAFLRAYLMKFNPGGSLWFSWAYTCSKMRVNEFGGGAVVVTSRRVMFFDAQDWATRRAASAAKRLATK